MSIRLLCNFKQRRRKIIIIKIPQFFLPVLLRQFYQHPSHLVVNKHEQDCLKNNLKCYISLFTNYIKKEKSFLKSVVEMTQAAVTYISSGIRVNTFTGY